MKTEEALLLLPVRASSRQEREAEALLASIDESKQAFLAEELFLIMMGLYEDGMPYVKSVALGWKSIYNMIFQYLGERRTPWGQEYSLELRLFQTLHLGNLIFRTARARFYAHVQAEEIAHDAFMRAEGKKRS